VLVDRVQIEAVLHNLLANAVDALKGQEEARTVRIVSRPDAPGFVRIAVEDNGPGVAPDVAASLFEPFVTKKAKVMGLGLEISLSIVDEHGGRLRHEPRLPGSAFCFTVPAAA
jgi:two-component system sensor kinase FixL